MKYLLVFAIASVIQFNSFSQSNLLKSTCDCFDKLLNAKLNKSDFMFGMDDCLEKVIYAKSISLKSKDSADSFISKFDKQLKSSCDAFNKCRIIWDKMSLEKSQVKIENKKSCKTTMQVGEFEDNWGAPKTNVSMMDSIQVVTWPEQGFYTKSKVVWTDECVYHTIFIETNNPFENSRIMKGDEREIRIIEIRNGDEIIFEAGQGGRWAPGRLKKIR